MTREQWAKLTPEEQRIWVAELCGYTVAYTKDEWPYLIGPDGIICSGVYHFNMEEELWMDFTPGYLNDLNAMHDAEKLIPDHSNYSSNLMKVCAIDEDWFYDTMAGLETLLNATAAQRAEAFVLTMEDRKDEISISNG